MSSTQATIIKIPEPTGRMTRLASSSKILRDSASGNNYHLETEQEATDIICIINGYQKLISELTSEIEDTLDTMDAYIDRDV